MSKRRPSVRFDAAAPEESKEEAGPLIEEKTAEGEEEHGGRREQFREIAQRRAAHFARAEKSTSSTPTGSLRSAAGGGGEGAAEIASWPGPFSTAREILEQRERQRERQRESDAAHATDALEDEETDEYDRELRAMQWTPAVDDTHARAHTQTHTLSVDHTVPSLAELCLSLLTRFFDAVQGWEVLSAEQRERVAALLSREKRLTHEALLALAVPGADSLLLTDASQIDDNTLILAIEKMRGRVVDVDAVEEESERDRERAKKAKREQGSDEVVVHNEFNHLVRLQLQYAGRCFTDRAAAALVNHAQRLLSLSLTGCYQLTDDALVRVLSSCAQTLTALDLSCDNRLSVRALSCIAGLPCLQSLSLNHVSHLTDSDFSRSLLTAESSDGSDAVLPSLQSLSLDGLGELSDDCLSRLVRCFGARLQSLSLSETSASDAVLMAIRETCISLRSISLCRLNNVTSAGLLALFVNDPEECVPDSSSSSSSPSSYSSHATRMRAIGLVEEISFDGTINVTDDVVQQLCEQFGRSLRHLSLHGCHRLTDRSLVAIRWHCPQLEFLDLSFVRRVTEPALGLLVDHCLALSELHLFGSTQFTDRLYKGQRARQTLKIVGRFSIQ